MELKRVLAKDSRTAKDQVCSEFGEDALIVSNQRINGKTELIVAVDITEERIEPALPTLGEKNQVSQPSTSGFGKMLDTSSGLGNSTFNDKSDDKFSADKRDYVRAREIVDLVRGELSAIRKEITLSNKTQIWESDNISNEAIKNLSDSMSIAGIPVELKTLLLDHVKDIDNLDDAKKAISKHLIDNTQRDAPKIPNAGMHAIFGPSGSGKTLMVGKIANAAAQEFGPNNVAIISLGDNRLGAWNQTQMIGAQSGVECFRVRDRESFETLNRELSNRRLLLIDTPGIQFSEHASIIKSANRDIELHLILPADASPATAQHFLKQKEITWSSLMVSKVDESSHPWGLLKILCDTDIPITTASDSPLLSQSMKPVSIDGIINIAMEQIGDKNNFEEKVDLKITKEYEPKVFRPLNLPEKGKILDAK